MNKNDFLYTKIPYRGNFSPQNLTFNCNLQEFAQKITYISSLHTGGKLSSEEAYQQMQKLWIDLKHSKKGLKILK
jgi:hypothetical protein